MRKLILLFCLGIYCCGPGMAQAAQRAALILAHGGEPAFNTLLKTGFEKAAKRRNLQADIIVADGQEQQAVFVAAAKNHELVIVATDALHEILRDNAANFRRVMFGSIDAGIRAPNIMSVTFADEQAAFLAGAAAALAAKQQGGAIIGWLSGMDTPAMRSLFNGYSEGALLAAPGCRIIQAVVNSFTEPEAARVKTKWLLDSGAKIIALAAGGGNIAAAREARSRKAGIIALDAPAGAEAFGSICKALDKAVAEIVESAASGKFRRKEIITYDLANHGVNFALNDKGGDIRRRVEELRQELVKGNIRLHSLRQRALCDCLD